MNDFSPSLIERQARRELELAGPVSSRWLIFGIPGLLSAGLIWAFLAEVEEVVTAPGRIEPVGRVQIINHPDGGRVERLFVEDGQSVRRGDVLLSLASEAAEFEKGETETGYHAAVARVARLEAELSGAELVLPEAILAERPDLLARERELMEARAANRESRRQTLVRSVESERNQLRRAESDVSRLASNLDLLGRQLEAIEELAERGLYPKLKVIDMQRQANDLAGELAKAEAAEAARRSQLAQARSELDRLDKAWREEATADLTAAKTRAEQLENQLAGRSTKLDGTVVRAPADGIVQDLAVTGEGQSVSANAPLMKLVPTEGGLIVKAQIANEDVGRVAPDMLALIKVHAYDFARYGAIDGKVERVAADATATQADRPPTYSVTILAERNFVAGDPKYAVVPGMLVDVELTTGSRTIISYLTDTLVSYREKAFRES